MQKWQQPLRQPKIHLDSQPHPWDYLLFKTIDSSFPNRFCGGRGCQIVGKSVRVFGFFMWRRWAKVCHEVCHKAQILETSVRSLRLVHCFHQPVTRRRILPVKWIDRMRGKAATGFVCRLLGRMQINHLSLPSVSATAEGTRNIQWGYSSAG